jgi:hypothetical protein
MPNCQRIQICNLSVQILKLPADVRLPQEGRRGKRSLKRSISQKAFTDGKNSQEISIADFRKWVDMIVLSCPLLAESTCEFFITWWSLSWGSNSSFIHRTFQKMRAIPLREC